MSYLGRNPATDKTTLVFKLDTIAAGFNSACTTFNLTSTNVAVYPGTTRDLTLAIDGVHQEPDVAYTVSGSSVIFSTAPVTGSTFWGVLYGTPNFDMPDTIPGAKTFLGNTTFSANAAFNANASFAGLVTVTGGQIKFPASQVSSSDVNTLDDYEEGSWTPIIGGSTSESGQAYGTQVGRYTKIGNLVHTQFYVILSTKGTITGVPSVKGLPFVAENIAGLYSTGMLQWFGTTTNWCSMSIETVINTSYGWLMGANSSAVSSVGTLANTDITNGTQFLGQMSYRTTT